MHLCRWKFN